MNNKKITLITAFFDCGRGEFKSQKRTTEKYMDYFRFWARIKNDLIIYTSSENVEKIMSIRKSFGQEKSTKIISINNIWEIEQNLFQKMCSVEKNSNFHNWRYRKDDISNYAKYDYIMLMKYWFMQDAVKRGQTNNLVGWIDFGWNHGGECFMYPEEFDFEWQYPFSPKIHLFSLANPDNDTGVIRLQAMTDSIMGAPIVCSSSLCERLYEYCKQAMYSLISLDCIDDDQMLLRMAYKMHPQDFEIHISERFFLPMKDFGGEHLTIREFEAHTFNLPVRVRNKLYKIIFGKTKEESVFVKRLLSILKAER